MKKTVFAFAFLLLSIQIFIPGAIFSQQASSPTAADRGNAEQEFRRGVQAWYRGAFNDAVIQFEKALSKTSYSIGSAKPITAPAWKAPLYRNGSSLPKRVTADCCCKIK